MLLLVLAFKVFLTSAGPDIPVLNEIMDSGYSQIDKNLHPPGSALVETNCDKCWQYEEPQTDSTKFFNFGIALATAGLKFSGAWGAVTTSIGSLLLAPNDPYLDRIRSLDQKITNLINANTVSENHKLLGQHEIRIQQLAKKPTYVKEMPFRAGSSDNWMCTPTRQGQIRELFDEVSTYLSTYQVILASTTKLDKIDHNIARGSVFLKILDSIPFLAELTMNTALAALETEPALYNEGVGEYCISQMDKFRRMKTVVANLYGKVKPLALEWISSDCSNVLEPNRFPRGYPGAEFKFGDNPWSDIRWEDSKCATQQFGWFARHYFSLNRVTCGCNSAGCNSRISRKLKPPGKYSLIHEMHRECNVLHNKFVENFRAKYFAGSPAATKVQLMNRAYNQLHGSSSEPRMCSVRKRVAPDGRTTPIGYYLEAVQHKDCLTKGVDSLAECTFAVRQAHEQAYNKGNGQDYCGKRSYHTGSAGAGNSGSTGGKPCSAPDISAKCSKWKAQGRCGDSKPQAKCPRTCCEVPLNLGFQATSSSDDGEAPELSGAGPANASSSVLLSIALLLASMVGLVSY